MPIDDILKNMDNGCRKEKKQIVSGTEYAMTELISDSIRRLNELFPPHTGVSIDKSQLFLLRKWIKFKNGFQLGIMPLPRSDILELLSKQDADFKELMEISDMGEYIQDPIDITHQSEYNKMSALTGISKIIDFGQLHTFSTTGSRITIYSLDSLSLFVKDGELLRKYAKEIGIVPENKIIELDQGTIEFNSGFSPFSSKTLASFCKKTGIKSIQEMVQETVELLEHFRTCSARQDGASDVRDYLLENVKKYHPELVYEGSSASSPDEDMPPNNPIIPESLI